MAKRDLKKGELIDGGIGGDYFYGLIEKREIAEEVDAIPIALIDPEPNHPWRMKRNLKRDEVVTFDDLEIPDSFLFHLYQKQKNFLKNPS